MEACTLAKLIYAALGSVDRYVADKAGNFDWAVPDEEVHSFTTVRGPDDEGDVAYVYRMAG